MPLRLGTRGSALALAQARQVAERLRAAGAGSAEIVTIRTEGDHLSEASLPAIGGKGVFTKEIEEALLEGRIDLAVHSMKDLPTTLPEGLAIGAVPLREDPSDALVAAPGTTLADLPRGARVGTSSPRRRAQLLASRRDLDVRELRGNVPTRVERRRRGDFDAVVLASAGLARLGLLGDVSELIPFTTMVPAPGQGAIGVEIRAGDEAVRAIAEAIDDPGARAEVEAERSLLAALGGGCREPIAAVARREGDLLRLVGCVASPDGSELIRDTMTGPARGAERLGRELADRLILRGAHRLLGIGR